MRLSTLVILLIILSVISACAHPVTPPESQLLPGDGHEPHSMLLGPGMDSRGHHVMGMWELRFDFETEAAEAVPLRFAEGHFNVRRFLEEGPCYTCLTLLNFTKLPDNSFTVDVQLEHPFPGLDNFSGFDVRGIAIFNGTYTFPASGLLMSDNASWDVELLNADGYTRLFNPLEFPPGSGPALLTYTQGRAATPLAMPATLNGYKNYFPDEPRRLFRAGDSDIRNYHIGRPVGIPIRVGYVVDASWAPPLSKPVDDPLTDFGPEANCPEAYDIEVTIGSGMMPGCGSAPYQIDVWDHQGHDTVDFASIEAPDLMADIITDDSPVDMGGFTRFTGQIPNELEVGEGEYRVLVGIADKNPDPFLGDMVAYTLTTASVEYMPIEYEHSWRKHGRTLDNNNHNPYESTLSTSLTEVWTHQYSAGFGCVFDSTPTIGASMVYYVTSIPYGEEIWAMDLETGEPIWDRSIKFQPDVMIYRSTPTVGNCEVWVGGSTVFCFDSEDGDLVWGEEGEDAQYVSGGPVVVDGIVVIWSSTNYLSAFDAITGDFMWGYSNGEAPGNPGTPAVEDGVIYAGDSMGYAFALDLYSGDEIWKEQFTIGGPVGHRRISSAVVLADGLAWFGSYNCHLYGLDPADGSIEEDVPLGDQIPWASPAYDGTYLYQPTAYSPSYWQFFEGPFRVLAIDTGGSIEWEFPGVDTEAFWTSPVVANGIVWVPSDAGVIYMLDPATGNPVGPGQYALDDPVTGGMSILDGRLYIVDEGGKFYCLETG